MKNSPPPGDEVEYVDLVPVLGFGDIGNNTSRIVTNPYGDGSDFEENRNYNTFFLFSPIITGFSSSTEGASIGGTYSVDFMGTPVEFQISEIGGEILYDGTISDGSGWIKTWYNPTTRSFRYEQFVYGEDQDNYVSEEDFTFIMYIVSNDIMFGSDEENFIGTFDYVCYYQVSGEDKKLQGLNDAELYGGPLSGTHNGVGSVSRAKWNDFTDPLPGTDSTSLAGFQTNEAAILEMMKSRKDTPHQSDENADPCGFIMDPDLPFPFLEVDSDFATWDDNEDGIVDDSEFLAHFTAMAPEWAEVSTLIP